MITTRLNVFRASLVSVGLQCLASLALAGGVGVSPSGYATYAKAIAVPPGAGGLSPEISLNYEGSNTDNGQVGMGWSLRLVDTIYRCDNIRALDALPRAGVRYSQADRLCLNGHRLIQVSTDGSNPQLGAAVNDARGSASGAFVEFRTESDPYTRIRSYGYADGSTAASGPAYFKVWTKSGQIISYGADPAVDTTPAADGTPALPSSALIRAYSTALQPTYFGQLWAVSRISDRSGNFIDFKYAQIFSAWGSSNQRGREWKLAEVQYSGNKVIFGYDTRTSTSPQDSSETYNNGSKNLSTQRLKSIVTYINSPNTNVLGKGSSAVAVTAYNLVYENGPVTKRSRLKSLQQCAGDTSSTKCLPAATFSYSNGADDAYTKNANFNLPLLFNGAVVTPIDMNNDGRTDLVKATGTDVTIYLSNGDGSFSQMPGYTGRRLSTDCLYATAYADFNGDGLIDILRYPTGSVPNGATPCSATWMATAEIHLNKGDGTFTYVGVWNILKDLGEPVAPTGNMNYYPARGINGKSFYIVDVDGDGISDIVTSIYPSTSNMDSSAVIVPCTDTTQYPQGCTQIFKGNGNGTFTQIPTNIATGTLYAKGAQILGLSTISDVDGDGLPDIFVTSDPQQIASSMVARIRIARSLGNGNFELWTGPECLPNPSGVRCGATPINYNGSAAASLLFVPSGADPSTNALYLRDSAGNALTKVTNFNLTSANDKLISNPADSQSETSAFRYFVGDFNNDGREDILRTVNTYFGERVKLYLSNGDGTFSESSTFSLTSDQYWHASMPGAVLIGDFLGTGQLSIINANGNVLFAKNSKELPDLLTSVTDELGAVTRIRYVPGGNPVVSGDSLGARYVSDVGTTNAAGDPAVSGKVDLPPSAPLVIGVDYDYGGDVRSVEYAYYGLKANRWGRGSVGFREVRSQVIGPDTYPLTTVTKYWQDFPYIGQATQVTTHQTWLNLVNSGTQLTNTVNVYCDQTAASGADTQALSTGVNCSSSAVLHKPYLLRSIASGVDLAPPGSVYPPQLPTVTTVRSVTASGDPLVTTTTSVGPAGDTFRQTVTNSYFTDDISCTDTLTCKWLLGLVQRRVTRGEAPSVTSMLATAAPTPATFTLTSCVASGPTQVPVAATYTCTLGNAGKIASNVSYSTSIAGATMIGPTQCAASTSNCGSVVVTSPTSASSNSGTVTAAPISGNAATTSSITLTVQNPSASLSTPAFAATPVGSSTTAAAILQNTGVGTISVTPPTASSVTGTDFSFVSTTCGTSLTPNATCSTTIRFAPTVKDTRTGSLSISTLAGTSTAAMSGFGQQAFINGIAGTLSLGNVQIGQSATSATVTFNNTGNVGATGFYINLPAGYSLSGSSCPANGGTLNAQASCSFVVTFTPTAAQSYNGTLSSGWTGPNSGSGSIALQGTGTAPSISKISADNFDYNTPASTGSGHYVGIQNNGYGPVTVNGLTFTTSAGNFNAWMAAAGNGVVGGYCAPGMVLQAGQSCGAWANDGTSGPGQVSSGTVTFQTTAGNATYTGTLRAKGLSFSGTTTGAVVAATSGNTASLYTLTINNSTPFTYYFPMYATYGGATRIGRFTGGNASNFVVTGTTCGGTLAPSGSCDVSIAATNVATPGQAYSSSFQPNGTYQQTGDGTNGVWAGAPNWLVNMGTSVTDVYVSGLTFVNASTAALPTVDSASFASTTMTDGATSPVFSWSTSNATTIATSCSGVRTGSSSAASGSLTLAASGGAGTITCTVTATNAVGNQSTTTRTATIVAPPSVSTAAFASPTVTTGNSVGFNWATANATSATVACSGTTTGSGSGTSGSLSATTSGTGSGQCTVTATNAAGTNVQSSGFVNVVAAPSAGSPSFSPTAVGIGSSSTFTWATANATTVAVACSGAGISGSSSAASGSLVVTPSTAGTGTCTVTATNAAGTQSVASASVTASSGTSVTLTPSAWTVTTPKSVSQFKTFVVTNNGAIPASLSISITHLSGTTGVGSFMNNATGSCGSTLNPNSSCTVDLEFVTGCTAATRTGTLKVMGNFTTVTSNLSATVSGGSCT